MTTRRGPIRRRPRRQRSARSRRAALTFVAVGLAAILIGVTAISTNTLGAGRLFDRAVAKVDRFLAGPVPDRAAPGTVQVTDPPGASEEPDPDEGEEPDGSGEPPGSGGPSPSIPATDPVSRPVPVASDVPAVSAQPKPPRVAVDLDIVHDHKAVFAHEIKDTWCASAGVQMTLAVLGLGTNANSLQREIQGRVREWESKADSHNGEWGPSAMALALDAYGATGYEVRAYQSRQAALRDAARAIMKTGSPAILLAWRGAHTWVMTGFRADADPTIFSDAKIAGTYILDPWYPDISSIWGPSDPPGTFQDNDEMVRNFLKWKRPEGKYADRDGKYVVVVPTVVRQSVASVGSAAARGSRGGDVKWAS